MASLRHTVSDISDPNNHRIQVEQVGLTDQNFIGDLEITSRPYGGNTNWMSMYYTNFPKLKCIEEQENRETNKDLNDKFIMVGGDDLAVDRCIDMSTVFFFNLAMLSYPQMSIEKVVVEHLKRGYKKEMKYVTYPVARKDLCMHAEMPKRTLTLEVEVLQYDGRRQNQWKFPLASYIPNKSNHGKYDAQTRRYSDDTQIVFGVNAEDFSAKVMPVGDLDAVITISDYAGNPTWGYYCALLRIQGWPIRVKRIGTYDSCGEGGAFELLCGIEYFDEKKLWNALEGRPTMAPTGPNGELELQTSNRKGCKYWMQIYDLDTCGYSNDGWHLDDPEIPPQKAYIRFEVLDTISVASTGKKGVQIRILDDGIVPCWMDLMTLQVWCGTTPLGYFNSAGPEDPEEAEVTVHRVLEDGYHSNGVRKTVIENKWTRLVFDDPERLEHSDLIDYGRNIFDSLYNGGNIRLGPRQGKWAVDIGDDAGWFTEKGSDPTPLWHGEKKNRKGDRLIQRPLSKYHGQRRIKRKENENIWA